MKRIKKYLKQGFIAVVLAAVLVGAFTFPGQIENALLQEKLVEVTNMTGMISAIDYTEQHIIDAAEYMDNLFQVYGAAYRLEDGETILITARNFETSIFEPKDYPEFNRAVKEKTSGNLVIRYKPDRQTYRDLHIYFERIDEQYLIVAGVSKYSVENDMPLLFPIEMSALAIIIIYMSISLAHANERIKRIDEQIRRGP